MNEVEKEPPPLEVSRPESQPGGGAPVRAGGRQVVVIPEAAAAFRGLLPLAGWSLLAFALIDYLYILLPFHPAEPNWEFSTIGRLVGQVWLPLVGVALVFYRDEGALELRTARMLSWVSWGALVLGVLYLLLAPLAVADAVRIGRSVEEDSAVRMRNLEEGYGLGEGYLRTAATTEQMLRVVSTFTLKPPEPRVIDDPLLLRDHLMLDLLLAKGKKKGEIQKSRHERLTALVKNTAKYVIVSVLSGVLFAFVWVRTSWVRIICRDAG